jgi:arylsulfatase A-like enzyme/Tfp pilus assembly protein PilF
MKSQHHMGKSNWQPFRRRPVRLAVLGLSALALGLFGWRSLAVSPRANVLLITLDTTRADRLGCSGYARALTPTLDELAARGVIFERAYTPAPLTLPSHASMMTGLYPPEHGLITNGRGRLDDRIPTLAEIFRDAGCDTAAFVGSFVLHSKFGLERGFALYDDDMTNTRPTEHGLHRQRDGARVVDSALAWLQKRRKKPFFCWVHLYDAHFPYDPHVDEFGERFKDAPYDGEIAYLDRQIQKLLNYLQANRLSSETLIVVVADHGESLGDHEEAEHGLTLYNSALGVPWIWAGPGIPAAGRRVPQPVSLVDLRPTLLEAVGLPDRGATSGRSLCAALAAKEIEPGNCYSATDDPLLEHGCSPLRSLATANWKFIRTPEVELYELSSDPQETRNLAADRPEQVRKMDEELKLLEGTMTATAAAAVELSSKERQALASLGYLGGKAAPSQPAPEGKELPDVKRLLPIYKKLQAAHRLLVGGDATGAEERLRELSREAPDYLPAQRYLAVALKKQNRLGESREIIEQVLERDPDDSEAHFERGAGFWEQKRFAEAAEEFRESLAINPHAEGSLFALAQALVQLGQFDEAERSYREALEQDPVHVEAHVSLGNLLKSQKRVAEAEEHYREALKYTPGLVEAHDNLAILLSEQERWAEAGEHFRRAVELAPQNPQLQYNFGTFLLLTGHFDEAVRALEESVRLDPQHPQAGKRLERARSMLRQ